jgi:hypothetical protein
MSHQVIFKTAGSTSQSIDISLLQNSGSTAAGDPALGLAYNTTNLTAYYQINGTGTLTSISLATQTATGAWSSGGFVKRSDTNAPGLYRFDIPNAVIASAGYAVVSFAGAPAATAGNMETHHLMIMCTAVDLFTAGGGILTTQMSESYAATTVVPTPAQALMMILQTLLGFNGSGATYTVYKRDNATTALVGTFTSSSNATGMTQTT